MRAFTYTAVEECGTQAYATWPRQAREERVDRREVIDVTQSQIGMGDVSASSSLRVGAMQGGQNMTEDN